MATENLRRAAIEEAEALDEDFDKAHEEQDSPYATIEILGREFQVNRAMPGWVNFFIGKYGTGKAKEVPPERYLEFIVRVCGDDITDHIIDNAPNDMDTEELAEQTVNKIKAVWESDAKKKNQ